MTFAYTAPERPIARRNPRASRAAWPRRILLATDGSPAGDPAVLATRALARDAPARVDAITIFAPRIPVPASSNRCAFGQCETPDRAEAARLLRAVRRQQRRLVPDRGERRDWIQHFEVGDPGATIVRLAAESAADLVVVGIGQEEPLDERAGGRTAVCAARYLTVPLYAPARGYEEPTRCVVAFPGGRVHPPTIRAALACLPAAARIWVAVPRSATQTDGEPAPLHDVIRRAYGSALAARVDRTGVERIEIGGDFLSGVLRAADELDAQLIAVPNHGAPGAVRSFLPNLAEPLLFGGRCSVLVVPD